MKNNIINKNIKQCFADVTYKCIPPSFINYKLFILCGIDVVEIKRKLLAIVLIPNEKEFTYSQLYSELKNSYFFNPIILTSDFCKAHLKSVRKIFPEVKLLPCFFHFCQAIYKNLKKWNYFKKENINEGLELLFNIKKLCFINPSNIKKAFKKIKKNYTSENAKHFLN